MNIGENGIIKISTFSEFLANNYDTEVYIEPDNSCWMKIFHHNNPNTDKLFATTDPFTSQVYIDKDRWFNVALCNYLSNSWELMIKQKETSTSDEVKYRWIQYANPMTAAFGDVDAADVTKNSSSEYVNPSNYGGVYLKNTDKTYLCCNSNSSGSWWGAIGACDTYQSGVPAYASKVVTTGYIDLYLRLDTHTNLNTTSFNDIYIKTKELIEV